MADKEIYDLTNKAAPVTTDEIEIQETSGGDSKKATIGSIFNSIQSPRFRRAAVSSAGALRDGSSGFASVSSPSTGRFDITLTDAVSAQNDVVCLATVNSAGGGVYATAAMTSTTVCRVDIKDTAGTNTNANFSILIIDWT